MGVTLLQGRGGENMGEESKAGRKGTDMKLDKLDVIALGRDRLMSLKALHCRVGCVCCTCRSMLVMFQLLFIGYVS